MLQKSQTSFLPLQGPITRQMKSDLSAKRVGEQDRKFEHQNRKVLLIVDYTSAHVDVGGLKAIDLATQYDTYNPANGSGYN